VRGGAARTSVACVGSHCLVGVPTAHAAMRCAIRIAHAAGAPALRVAMARGVRGADGASTPKHEVVGARRPPARQGQGPRRLLSALHARSGLGRPCHGSLSEQCGRKQHASSRACGAGGASACLRPGAASGGREGREIAPWAHDVPRRAIRAAPTPLDRPRLCTQQISSRPHADGAAAMTSRHGACKMICQWLGGRDEPGVVGRGNDARMAADTSVWRGD